MLVVRKKTINKFRLPKMLRTSVKTDLNIALGALFFTVAICGALLFSGPNGSKMQLAVRSYADQIECSLSTYDTCISGGGTESACSITIAGEVTTEISTCMSSEKLYDDINAYAACTTKLEADFGACITANIPADILAGSYPDFSILADDIEATCITSLELAEAPAGSGLCKTDTAPGGDWVASCTAAEYLEATCNSALADLAVIATLNSYGPACQSSVSDPALTCTTGLSACMTSCTTLGDYADCTGYCSLGSPARCEYACNNGLANAGACTTMCTPVGYVEPVDSGTPPTVTLTYAMTSSMQNPANTNHPHIIKGSYSDDSAVKTLYYNVIDNTASETSQNHNISCNDGTCNSTSESFTLDTTAAMADFTAPNSPIDGRSYSVQVFATDQGDNLGSSVVATYTVHYTPTNNIVAYYDIESFDDAAGYNQSFSEVNNGGSLTYNSGGGHTGNYATLDTSSPEVLNLNRAHGIFQDYNKNLDFSYASAQFTVEAWVKNAQVPAAGFDNPQAVVSKIVAGNDIWTLGTDGNNGIYCRFLFAGNVEATLSSFDNNAEAVFADPTAWNRLRCIFNNGVITAAINDTVVATDETHSGQTLVSSNAAVLIGASNQVGGAYGTAYRGDFDDIKVKNVADTVSGPVESGDGPAISYTAVPVATRFTDRPLILKGYAEDDIQVASIKFTLTKSGTTSDEITLSCQDSSYANRDCANTREYFTVDTTAAMANLATKTGMSEPSDGANYTFNITTTDTSNNSVNNSTIIAHADLTPTNNIVGSWDFQSYADGAGYFPEYVTDGQNSVSYVEGGGHDDGNYAVFNSESFVPDSCQNAKLELLDFNRNFDFSGSSQQFTAQAWIKGYADNNDTQIILSKADNTAGQDNWAMGVDSTRGLYCSFKLTNGVQTVTSAADNPGLLLNPTNWTKVRCIYNNGTIAAVIGDATVASKTFEGETLVASSGKVYMGNSASCNGYVGYLDDVSVRTVADSYSPAIINDGQGPTFHYTSIPGNGRMAGQQLVVKGYAEDPAGIKSLSYFLTKDGTTSSSILSVACQDSNYTNRECSHTREYFTIVTTQAMVDIALESLVEEPADGSSYSFHMAGTDVGDNEGSDSLISSSYVFGLTNNLVSHWDFESASDVANHFSDYTVNEGLNAIDLYTASTAGADGGRFAQFSSDNYTANSCSMSNISADDYIKHVDFANYNSIFTVEAWVKNTAATGSPQIVVSKASPSASSDTWALGVDEVNGIYCSFKLSDGVHILSSALDNPNVKVDPTVWTNLKCVYNNGVMYAMLNDLPVTVKSANGATLEASDQPVLFGNSKSCHGFSGAMDEVKIFESAAALVPTHTVVITNPANLAQLQGGGVYSVRWYSINTNEDPVETVDIEYSVDNGSHWTSIVNDTANTGSYIWTVPALNQLSVKLKVTISDTESNVYSSTITVGVDSTPPEITWVSNVETLGQTTYTLNVHVEDTNLNAVSYALSSDSTCNSSDSYETSITSDVDFTVNGLENDGKYVCIKASDTFEQNSYSASANPLFSVDAAPIIVIDPRSDAERVLTARPTFTGRITDPDGIAGAEYTFLPTQFLPSSIAGTPATIDEADWYDITPVGGTWGTNNTFSIQPAANLSDGNQFLYIRAHDNVYDEDTAATAAHKSLYTNSGWIYFYGVGSDHVMAFYKVFVNASDTLAPDILASAIQPDPTTDTNPYLHGYVKDDEDDKTSNIASIQYKLDDGNWVVVSPYNKPAFNSTGEEFEISLQNVSVGTHTLTIRAVDASGNDTNAQDKNYTDEFEVVGEIGASAEVITKTEDFESHEYHDQFNTTGIWGNGKARITQTIDFEETLKVPTLNSTPLDKSKIGYLYGNRVVDILPATDGNLWLIFYDNTVGYYNKNTNEVTEYATIKAQANSFPHFAEFLDGTNRYLAFFYESYTGIPTYIYNINNTPENTSDDSFVSYESRLGGHSNFLLSSTKKIGDNLHIYAYDNAAKILMDIDTKGTVMNTVDDTYTAWTADEGFQHNSVDPNGSPVSAPNITAQLTDGTNNRYLAANYEGGLNICTLTSPKSCTYNSTVSHSIYNIINSSADPNVYWLSGNPGLFVYDTKGTLAVNDDVYAKVLDRNIDLAGEWASRIFSMPGDGAAGEEIAIVTNNGHIRILETNDSPLDLNDDTLISYELPSDEYSNWFGVTGTFTSKEKAWIFMPGTGLFDISLTRDYEAQNVIEVLPTPPQGILEVNHIKLNSVEGTNLYVADPIETVRPQSTLSSVKRAYAAGQTSLVDYFVSNDSGKTWYPITIGQQVDFPTSDYLLKFKMILHSANGVTPVITGIDLSYALYPTDSALEPDMALEYPEIATVGDTFDGGVEFLDELGYTPNWNGTVRLELVEVNDGPSDCIAYPSELTVIQGQVEFDSEALCPGTFQFKGETALGGLKAVGHQIIVRDVTSCGNNTVETGEQCDGSVGSISCSELGFDAGTLSCNSACMYNTAACTTTTPAAEAVCGNGIVEAGEQCDGTVAMSCADLKLGTGNPSCTDTCILDTSACAMPIIDSSDPILDSPVTAGVTGLIAVISAVLSISIMNLAIMDLPVIVVSWWLNLLSWLGVRRRNQQFGYVYDAVTKNPISQAIVRIYEESGRLIRTEVTNVYGIFSTKVDEGKYRIVVIKSGFNFPSSLIRTTEDKPFTNVYNGEWFADSGTKEITISIPLDPVKPAFSEIMQVVIRNNVLILWRLTHFILFVASFVFSIYMFSRDRSVLNTIILLLYLPSFALLLASTFDTKIKLGKITDEANMPKAGLKIGLKETDFNRLVANRVTDVEGFYRFIVPKGEYNFELLDPNYEISKSDRAKVEKIKANQSPTVYAKDIRVKAAPVKPTGSTKPTTAGSLRKSK